MKEKCQRCSKQATYHITDKVTDGEFRVFHLCDEHVRQHLAPVEEPHASVSELASGLAKAGRSAREPSAADRKTCPYCQLSFHEFKNSGRLGCPHDYEVFRDELMPLLESIHNNTQHGGKSPRRAPRSSQRQNDLIELRKRLKQAIEVEDYETAAHLRDQIKGIEQPGLI